MDVKQKKLTLSVVLGIMGFSFFLHARDASHENRGDSQLKLFSLFFFEIYF
jgi:hypothetical protein